MYPFMFPRWLVHDDRQTDSCEGITRELALLGKELARYYHCVVIEGYSLIKVPFRGFDSVRSDIS